MPSALRAQVSGRLEGGDIKLDMSRLEAMMQREQDTFTARRNSMKIRSMWEQFKTKEEEAGMCAPSKPTSIAQEAQMAWDAEAVFRRCLPLLEAEANEQFIQRRRRTLRLKKGLQDAQMAHAASRFMKGSAAARAGGSRRRVQAAADGGSGEARAA